MSGTRPNSAERRIADQHLGDRLSALVDGELGHESRERVLAHLATCAKCKAEADAQRRLKNVFAEVAPPPPPRASWHASRGCPGEATPTAVVRRSTGEASAEDCPAGPESLGAPGSSE
uniref:Putative zinc-finger domain-containing protein n=1 Tax=Streptomyces avermitilis TaxID=33903 RepID=A0A499V976_STRAX|nr:hypothetical protein SAVMC3_36020 [Streptomyces avermitilis]